MGVKFFKFSSHKDEFIEEMKKKRAIALETVGLVAERYAKERARVDTGRMRNSITHATSEFLGVVAYSDNNNKQYLDGLAKNIPEEDAVYIGTNVEYAPFIELGTSRNRSYPFLRPALQNHIDEYKSAIEKIMKS